MEALERRLPPPIWFLVMFGLMTVTALAPPDWVLDWPGQRVIAIVIAGFAIAVGAAGLVEIYRHKTTTSPTDIEDVSQLVVTGIYRFTRNPMYLGLALLLVAYAVALGDIWTILFVPVFVVIITYGQIKPEERVLAERFGGAYRDYTEKVRRWV
ncbi:hypothetical protein PB2503_04482 [Parvularcula bermudensis HTCC2503]|uniref:Isoprenylcysteine carboxyl methyltransferase family protein n=1 Tax=Parvularcula bermudensis (strain ATCC BAA-594 / HTCC2503 / KCTC 12087) TaxID=314260 RepID=E0TF53_PARBH|nr:isoprenylcysteine carboxylmethyltransferase family protein [Parvularcula bermudensis]ADM08971.1 hypothetical protein PB2503_04482 [Parvularcula bermudensis HTCC2503]